MMCFVTQNVGGAGRGSIEVEISLVSHGHSSSACIPPPVTSLDTLLPGCSAGR